MCLLSWGHSIFEKINNYKEGSHYTPSLITEFICKETIESIIINKYQKNKYISTSIESLQREILTKNINEANRIFDSITIIDPSVGSGHFLVTALNTMIVFKNKLGLFKSINHEALSIVDDNIYIDIDEKYTKLKANKASSIQKIYEEIYESKTKIISNSLFGVDINSKSVKIARLRLWIELLKHSYYTDESNYETLQLLPNIDINIKRGDSLLYSLQLNESFNGEYLLDYREKTYLYKTCRDKKEKIKLKSDLEKYYNKFNKKFKSTSGFEWRYAFPEVLDDDGNFLGFDAIIGNPPYIKNEKIKEIKPSLKHQYRTFQGKADIYVYFYELSYNLLKDNGIFSYICSNKLYKATYAQKLREFILDKMTVKSLSNFENAKVFENAIVSSDITMIQKKKATEESKFNIYDKNFSVVSEMKQENLSSLSFVLLEENKLDLKKKIESKGTILKNWSNTIRSGIKTGFNTAFIIDENTKNDLISKNIKNADLIKPYIRGRNIQKYNYSFNNEYIIVSKYKGSENIKLNYPDIYNFLNNYKKELESRAQVKNQQHHWLELDNNPSIEYLNLFEEEKIAWIELSNKNKFYLDSDKNYLDMTAFFITGQSLRYLLAFLNSKLIFWYFNLICNESGMGTNRWKKAYVEQLPIILPTKENEKKIESLVNKILKYKEENKSTLKLEDEIDNIIYELYSLESKEIEIIEKEFFYA